MIGIKVEKINNVEFKFTTDVSVLKELFSQHFGSKEAERLAFCPLAQSIMDLKKANKNINIGHVRIEKPTNAAGSIIIVRSLFAAFTDDQIAVIKDHLTSRLNPMQMANTPLIDEKALIARLPQDEFIPEPGNLPQSLFAKRFNKFTLPGVRGHGGDIKVKRFIDNGPNNDFSVEVVAYGSCMKCGSAGTLTLSSLQRYTAQLFQKFADDNENKTFGNIFVYEESNPEKLAYIVKADGLYDALNRRTAAFAQPQPSTQ